MESELSPENTEKLVQFQELSGIDDLNSCTEILKRHNWNVEAAIHDHLGPDSRELVQPPIREIPVYLQQNGHSQVQRPMNSINRPQPVDSIFQRIMTFFFNPFLDENTGIWPLPNQRPQGFTGWLLFFSSLPLRVVVITFYQFTTFVMNLVRPEQRPAILDPTANVTTFIKQYDETYGEQHPTFFAGTYSQVLNEAKKDLKFLFEGFIAPEAFIQRLRAVITDNEAFLVAARADREERSFNQALREEQDQAYLESLRADQEKEEKKRREQLLEEERLREIRELQLAEERKKEEMIQKKLEAANLVPAEPNPEEKGICRILIRLPQGKKLERRFHRTIHTLRDLYYFILSHPDSPYQFEMATSYPKKTLAWEPDLETYPTLAELGFSASEALLVLDLDA
nr:EOG090X0B12 [Megafenestra aurita]